MESSSTNAHIVSEDLLRKAILFTAFCFKRSVKNPCVAKIFLAAWGTFLCQNDCNYTSYKFSHQFAFITFCDFHRNEKQKNNFSPSCYPGNEKYFCFLLIVIRALLQGHPKSIGFYKGMFKRYTNADLKICQYLCLYMKITCWRFHIKTHFTFWDMRTRDM